MSSCWHVSPLVKQYGLHALLSSLDDCFAIKGKLISKGPRSTVEMYEFQGMRLYIKRYRLGGGSRVRQYFGRSRARAEWENLQWLERLGLPVPTLLAYGEEYQKGRFQRGALITAALPDAADLEKLIHQKSPLLFDKKHFRDIAGQVAAGARAMHARGFTHNDLDLRNILVSPVRVVDAESDKPVVYFFDCPGGRRWIWPFLEYRVVKDLAHLDKIAREYLSPRWRLWFYHQYTGRSSLNAADKRRIRKVLAYYIGR